MSAKNFFLLQQILHYLIVLHLLESFLSSWIMNSRTSLLNVWKVAQMRLHLPPLVCLGLWPFFRPWHGQCWATGLRVTTLDFWVISMSYLWTYCRGLFCDGRGTGWCLGGVRVEIQVPTYGSHSIGGTHSGFSSPPILMFPRASV